ncbi:uncharacterized protein LOC135429446 [Drosophila montana]|uniref:uncharacterized protein LOC135429446 n=1 Tax=Drosophila montana TaxID=40370 RepID=UPI00313E42D0
MKAASNGFRPFCGFANSHLETIVSQVLSALLNRLTELEQHEADLRACQTNTTDMLIANPNCPTATQYEQILCRLEKKLAKNVGPEEFLQCSSLVLFDEQLDCMQRHAERLAHL